MPRLPQREGEQLLLPSFELPVEREPGEAGEDRRWTLDDFLELVDQQLSMALERTGQALPERTLTAASVAWLRRQGRAHDPLALFFWILRAARAGADPEPHHARLAAATALAYVASELRRRPEEGPWALARPETRRACRQDLLRVALRLAQGSTSCTDLLDAHAEVLADAELTPRAVVGPPALELVCTCAALSAGPDPERAGLSDQAIDALAAAGSATARVRWWLEDLGALLGPLDRVELEARRRGPALQLFAEVSSFEQRESFDELIADLPESGPLLREFLRASGLVARCAEAIEAARREVHERLVEFAEVLAEPDATQAASAPARAGLRNWLVTVDGLAARVYRVPETPASAELREPEGPWSRLLAATLDELCDRVGCGAGPGGELLPRPRLQAWGQPQWRYDPQLGVVLYPDLDGQPEELLATLAEHLATDLDEVETVLESLAPLILTHEAVLHWRDAAGLRPSAAGASLGLARTDEPDPEQAWGEAWAASRISIAYLQRHEPAVLALLRRVADHSLAAHDDLLGPDERLHLEAVLEGSWAGLWDQQAESLSSELLRGFGARSERSAVIQLAIARELLLQRLDLELELEHFVHGPRRAAVEQAANQALLAEAGSLELPAREDFEAAADRVRARAQPWVGGISAAIEQAVIELCPPVRWRRGLRAVLAEGRGNLIDLWAELADEFDMPFTDGCFRGALNYVQLCAFELVDDLQDGEASYVDARQAPLIQIALTNLAAHLQAYADIDQEDAAEASALRARCHAAQWRETQLRPRSSPSRRREPGPLDPRDSIDAATWWEIAEGLAGDQLAADFVGFLSGIVPSGRAAAIGRALGLLAHLDTDLGSGDPRLLQLGAPTICSLIDRALGEARLLADTSRVPRAIQRRHTLLLERLIAARSELSWGR